MNDENISTNILIIRHGERQDFQENKNLNNFELDPELTELGIKQAINLAEHLKKEFVNKFPFKKIVIKSSPFLRALMTASSVANHLKIENIYITYGISEKLSFKLSGGKNPFDLLLSRKENKALVENKLNTKLLYEDENYIDEIVFPEKLDLAVSRFQNYINKVIEKEKDNDTLVLLFTHGAALESIRVQYKAEKTLIDYTSYSQITFNKNTKSSQLIKNCFCEHVERKKEFILSHGIYIL